MARMASYDEMTIIALITTTSNKEMKESAGKPTDDTQEIMQDDENNTENTQQKLRAAEGKFEDAVWPCHRSLMCDQYSAR